MDRVKIGIIGCGNISGIYFERATRTFEILDVAACADLIRERAEAQAAAWGVPRVCTVAELLADPEIEIGVNLTIPKAHYEVGIAALQAGKSLYGEKPLALTRAQGRELLKTAKTQGVRLGNAPDTFLGGGLQTCRKLIDDGCIGRPIAASAFMLCPGHESWHPDPEFYYKEGGGPLFDMGPYYLTALVHLIGPVKRVAGMTATAFPERTITSRPRFGTRIRVEVPTHIAGTMEFASGAIGTLITSFDVWAHQLPFIEIYGTEGSLSVPDPNSFGGPVRLRQAGAEEWQEMPLTHGNSENSRGIGVADMAHALRSGRAHRAGGKMAYHILDLIHAFHDSAREGRHMEIESTCERPAPLPVGLREGTLDERV